MSMKHRFNGSKETANIVQVELFGDDPNRLRIVIDEENDIELVVHTRHTRDVIALAVRGFAQRFQ
jgi:hypothetical protein